MHMLHESTTGGETAQHVDVAAIIAAIRGVTGPSNGPIALHEPSFEGNEWVYLKECLDSTFVSSVGAFVDRFERMVAEATGAAFGIAIVNGTAALHICLLLAEVGRDDEVIMPTLTFIATANAVSYCGAIPHFVDSSVDTLGLDTERLRAHLGAIAVRRNGVTVNRITGRRIAAIVPMHVLGLAVDLDGLRALGAEYDIPIVEDIAEALGSTYRNGGIAADTRLGALSFNGNKIVTTGGGGAIVTNDPKLAQRAKHMTTTAKLPHRWAFNHDEIGFNYRLPNLNAALGCAQLERLPEFVAAKRDLAARYRKAFAGIPGVHFVIEPEYATSNYWLNAILLDDDSGATCETLLAATHEAGLLTRPAWTLMHRLPMYLDCPRADLSVAESIERRLVKLPSSAHLGRRS
jgi:perosamine synthetase